MIEEINRVPKMFFKRYLKILAVLCCLGLLPINSVEASNVEQVIFNAVQESGHGEYAEWLSKAICYSAGTYSVDPLLITAVITAESNFNHSAVSSAGALGFMQLMPETARGIGVDPNDPLYNIIGGTYYLRTLLDRFSGQGEYATAYALAGYNAGPNGVADPSLWPAETHAYVNRVASVYNDLLSKYRN